MLFAQRQILQKTGGPPQAAARDGCFERLELNPGEENIRPCGGLLVIQCRVGRGGAFQGVNGVQ